MPETKVVHEHEKVLDAIGPRKKRILFGNRSSKVNRTGFLSLNAFAVSQSCCRTEVKRL